MMQFEFWQVGILTTVPPIIVGWVTWLLNRRAQKARDAVANDSVAVDTITDVMEQLRVELQRVKGEADQAMSAIRYVAEELDHAARVIAAHRAWDDAAAASQASDPPPLPSLPHSWEIMSKVRPQNDK
ncbi:MAG: hypothetical protein AB7U23_12560 [Dehalococcoidia bacterium]